MREEEKIQTEGESVCTLTEGNLKYHLLLSLFADDSEEDNLDSDLGQVGNHAFARMEGDVDKQRKLILQGQMSEAAMQKQHLRK